MLYQDFNIQGWGGETHVLDLRPRSFDSCWPFFPLNMCAAASLSCRTKNRRIKSQYWIDMHLQSSLSKGTVCTHPQDLAVNHFPSSNKKCATAPGTREDLACDRGEWSTAVHVLPGRQSSSAKTYTSSSTCYQSLVSRPKLITSDFRQRPLSRCSHLAFLPYKHMAPNRGWKAK